MRKLKVGFAAAIMLTVAATGQARAQYNSADRTAGASVKVVTAITIAKDTDLNFGEVVAGSTPGTVIMPPAGPPRTPTGGTTLGSGSGASSAQFTVSGDPNATYAITLPGPTTLSDGGSNTLTVNTFTSTPSGTGALSGGGTEILKVGATLQVPATQPSGTYTGSFMVTVTYN